MDEKYHISLARNKQQITLSLAAESKNIKILNIIILLDTKTI